MKKKWKIAITIFIAILLSVALFFTYILKFKKYDVVDAEVTEIVSNPYKIELPDGTTITIDDNGEIVESDASGAEIKNEQNTDGKTESPTTDKGAGTTTTNQDGGKVDSTSKPTVASVKEKYIPVFENLESQADGKINALIGRAKKEYNDKKANAESINYGYFYQKYMAAATELEQSTDAIFYGAIKAVENDLVKNGYNKSYAQNFIDEYESTKKARRDSILKKAVGI